MNVRLAWKTCERTTRVSKIDVKDVGDPLHVPKSGTWSNVLFQYAVTSLPAGSFFINAKRCFQRPGLKKKKKGITR